MEVEQQGPDLSLKSGEMLSWSVQWYGASVPVSVAVENGSQALVDLVATTLGTP